MFEVIKFDNDITDMIRNGMAISELRRIIGQKKKYQLIGDSGIEKILTGDCSFQDVYDKILVEEIIYQPSSSQAGGKAALDSDHLDYESYSPDQEQASADAPSARTETADSAAKQSVPSVPVQEPKPQPKSLSVAAPVTIVGQDKMTFAPTRKYVEGGESGSGEARKPSVLFVDDDSDMRMLIGRILQNNGYAVTSSTDGADALFHIAQENFDLIIADIEMPTLNGLAFASIIHDKGIKVPLIFLTSHDRQESESKAFSLGAEDFIQKPVQKEVFLMRIARALRRRA